MAALGVPSFNIPAGVLNANSSLEEKLELIKQHKIFVGGIRSHSHAAGIRKLFSKFGEVVEVEFPPNYGNAPGSNFCFVVFRDPNIVENLIKQKEVWFGKLRVDIRPYKVKKEFQEVDAKNIEHLLEAMEKKNSPPSQMETSMESLPFRGFDGKNQILFEDPEQLRQLRNQELSNLQRDTENIRSSLKLVHSLCDTLDTHTKKERNQLQFDMELFNQEFVGSSINKLFQSNNSHEEVEKAIGKINDEFLKTIPLEQVNQLSNQLNNANDKVKQFIKQVLSL